MGSVEYIYNEKTLPIVSKNDLNRYSLEQGVELREYSEAFVNAESYNNDNDDGEDDDSDYV